MDSIYIYFIGLILTTPLVFHILFKLKFQELFQANKVFEIKVAYVIASLLICHILASIIEKLYLLSQSFN